MTDSRGKGFIETPRLTLRSLAGTDAQAIVAGINNINVSKWLTVVPHPYGLADAEAFLEVASAHRDHMAIERSGQIVGIMSVGEELGYWLAEPAWGQGIASEAGMAITDHWFADPSNSRLLAGHFTENAASGAVLSKLGFVYTGTRKDVGSLARGTRVESRDMVLSRARWRARRDLPNLVTPRCWLRPLLPSDAQAMSKIAGIQEIARNTSSIPSPWPVDEARDWIAQGLWRGKPGFRLAICDHKARVIGLAGLSSPQEPGVASLAYLLEKAHWGRGIISEVMAAFIPAVFRAFPLDALEADHDIDNPASGAVLRKLGFTCSGQRITAPTRLRLEPTPVSHYRLDRSSFEARS